MIVDVGYLSSWGDDFCESIGYKNYVSNGDLIGYFEVIKELEEWRNDWMRLME
jgi:hypothetical protein